MNNSDELANINKWTKWSLCGVIILFFVLSVVYWKNFKDSSIFVFSPEGFGQFGDYIGGILNPIVAMLALAALWKTSKTQLLKEVESQQREYFFRTYDAYQQSLNGVAINGNGKVAVSAFIWGDGQPSSKNSLVDGLAYQIPSNLNDETICDYRGRRYEGKYGNSSDGRNAWGTLSHLLKENSFSTFNPVFRMTYHVLKSQSKFNNDFTQDNIHFFRAQLTEA